MSEKANINGMATNHSGIWALLQDMARLMVGVGNYPNYCAHMASQHPDTPPMTEVEYFRYCQEARYPGKSGSIKRCPC